MATIEDEGATSDEVRYTPSAESSPAPSDKKNDVDEKQRLRLKHREYVQRSYRKKRDTITQLKAELEALEEQYRALVQNDTLPGQLRTPDGDSPLPQQYVELANRKAALQQANAELYELNAQYLKAEGRIQQLLDVDDAEFPSLLPSSAAPRFRFTPLPDAEYAKIIATARDEILSFAYDTKKLSTGSRVFGWIDQRKVVGDELLFALEKVFPSVSAYELQARSWPIYSTPERFAQIYSASLNLKFYALQRINDDTHLFYRTVQVLGSDCVAKTVFLVARLRIENGYMVLFRAIDAASVAFQESERNQALEEMHAIAIEGRLLAPRKEVWVHKNSWVIFQEQGPDACLFHFGGSTLCTLWLKEVLFIALQWESMAVGPPALLKM